PLRVQVRGPRSRSCDVVVLLPRPAFVGPPFAALIAAALDEREVCRIRHRCAGDQVGTNVGAMKRAFVVVGEMQRRRADRARAGGDLDELESAEGGIGLWGLGAASG